MDTFSNPAGSKCQSNESLMAGESTSISSCTFRIASHLMPKPVITGGRYLDRDSIFAAGVTSKNELPVSAARLHFDCTQKINAHSSVSCVSWFQARVEFCSDSATSHAWNQTKPVGRKNCTNIKLRGSTKLDSATGQLRLHGGASKSARMQT